MTILAATSEFDGFTELPEEWSFQGLQIGRAHV